MDLETYAANIDGEYIQVLKLIDNLYKYATPQMPLKNILDYLGTNYSFIGLALYRKSSYTYTLVKSTGLLDYENSTEVVQSIYDCLDNEQTGIVYPHADMQPFKDFYFKFSEAKKFYDYVGSNPPKTQNIAVRQSKAPPPPNHIKVNAPKFKKITIGDVIKAKQHEGAISPNDYQRITMLYDYFTPHQAGCLIAGLHPAFDGSDDDLELALGVIEGGVKKERLTLDNDGQLNSDDLKSFLRSKGWVMTGFNDNLASDTSSLNKENSFYQKRVAELEKQVAGAEAEIVKLKNELKERPTAIDEDLKDVPHQSYRTVDRIMYAMAKISELSNTGPYSQNNPSLNASIATILQNDGLTLEYQAIGKWLTRVKNVQPMK
ncbi:hypothetical protein [Psychrobacter sp. NPDC078501]|uniref:hypothetical protein n=1 Tax=Psychrobacter sp. NPDC078501 TaxID=3364495 RepID=UPI00384E713C